MKEPEKEKKAKPEKADKPAKAAGGEGKGKGKPDAAPPAAEAVKHPPIKSRIYEKYKDEIVPALSQRFGRKNALSLPKLQKIVLNMGVGKALQDKNRMEQAVADLGMIAGQRPQVTKSRIAVSGFRLRENSEIGCRVTLRGRRMYEFLDRLIAVALPRIRDFRGINPNSFDGHGNYSFGVSEQMIFPEIEADKVNFTQGMDITFVTSTSNDDEARELLKSFGMPFREID
jgi:large subunit ribosomal protein L5